jgi:Ran GTPase-activating protein (RanGAP) involved in mRNA processing and transport
MREKNKKTPEPTKIKIPDPSRLDRVSTIDTEVAKQLATSEKLSKITTLDLEDSPIGDEGLAALLASLHLKTLLRLYLTNTKISDEACSILAQATSLKSLQELRLSSNQLSAKGLRVLLSSPNLKHLEVLQLEETPIGDEGAEALGAASLPALRSLSLQWCQLNAPGALALSRGTWAKHLSQLSVSHNTLADAGVESFFKGTFSSIERLSLGWTAISDASIAALAATPWPSLSYLDLRGNPLSDIGAEALAKSVNLQKLSALKLRFTSISSKGEKSLVRALPSLRGLDLAPLAAEVLVVCSYCRSKAPEDATRCGACDRDVTEGKTTVLALVAYKAQHRVTCHHCGAQRFEESLLCPTCRRWGQPL